LNLFKKMRLLICLLFLFGSDAYAQTSPTPDGHGCGAAQSKTPTTTVGITDAKAKAKELTGPIKQEAQEAIDALEIDVGFLKDWLEGLNLGWAADKVAEKAAELAESAAKKLEEFVKASGKKYVEDLEKLFLASVDKLDPKAIIQADVNWKERCCGDAQWSASAANPGGNAGALATLGFLVELDISGGAGVEAEVKLKITVTVDASWKVARFNPVRPPSGSGSSFTVTATPTWEASVKATVTAQAGIGGTIGVGVTPAGVLGDVSGTLTCPGP
jgi:hypothetical protein